MTRFTKKGGSALLPALSSAGLALLLAGCGGNTTTNNPLRSTQAAGPVVYGVEATAAIVNTGTFQEVSGFGSPDGTTAFLTEAIASTAQPIPAIAVNSTIPLGFAPGGQYLNAANASAVAPGAAVKFYASVSNGVNATTGQIPAITSVTLTSPEIPSFSQPLTFDTAHNYGATIGGNANGLANANYVTPTFTLPFTTTGLHAVVATITDAAGNSSTTTFQVVVVKPTDAALIVQVIDNGGAPVAGATATITNPVSGATQQTTSDAQGVLVLFAAPAAQQTVTVTNAGTTTTHNYALTAGTAAAVDASGAPLTFALGS